MIFFVTLNRGMGVFIVSTHGFSFSLCICLKIHNTVAFHLGIGRYIQAKQNAIALTSLVGTHKIVTYINDSVNWAVRHLYIP